MLTAESVAPWLAPGAIDAIQWSLARLGPRIPVLGPLVTRNMKAAGVYSPTVLASYFEQVALHLANGIRVFRSGSNPSEVAELARRQIDVDDSMCDLRRVAADGKGAVVAPAHTCNYVLTLARLHQDVPVCVYLRWSSDQRKRELKHAWCRAAGLDVILEPQGEADPTSRAAKCVEALRAGKVLVMTPDIAQKAGKGISVKLFDRTANFPTGPASIAMLAESPFVPLFGRLENDKQILQPRPPIEVRSLPRAAGGRKAALRQTMQTWADQFQEFLRRSPAAWFLWGDSRWSRFFAGDSEYTGGPVGEAGQTP